MRVGSLCSGIGGIELGLASVTDVEVAWHSEVDPAACRVLEERWPGVTNLGDLRAVDWENDGLDYGDGIARSLHVDLLTAGYPCQPFSHAGRRGGEDDPRHLWPAVANAVRVLRPGRVLLENVAGHLSLGFGRVLGDLAEAGFDAEWCCVRSSDVGAPHRRERVFILAHSHADSIRRQGAVPEPQRDHGRGHSGPTADPERRAGRATNGRDVLRRWTTDPEQAGLGCGHTPPDTDGEPTGRNGQAAYRAEGARSHSGDRSRDGCGAGPFGVYTAAVDRWEHVAGRDAPAPSEGGKLSPAFVEWMLGYPDGWTLPAGSRNARLRCLGNSVQPQVAALAWQELT